MAAVVGEILGLTVSEGISFALGVAMGPALRPLTQEITNKTWDVTVEQTGGEAHMPLDAATLAGLVAQGIKQQGYGQDEARMRGIRDADFDALLKAARKVPDFGQLDEMLNRGTIELADFNHALDRMGIEAAYRDGLRDLTNNKLSPAQVALGIVRSLLSDPGFLPVDLNTSGGKVPGYQVSTLDPVKEAAAAGIDRERLRVMVGETGRPMGPETAASAVFRGIIARADFNQAIATGDIRPEWADAIFEEARQIPTARDFLENALRGYRTLDQALKGAARHGMSEDDATMIYQNQGRPMAVRQITQALSRGGQFQPEPGEIRDPYRASIVEGNLKPAYYDLADSLKYTLPSAFVMRSLTESGVWSEAKAAKRLKDSGWIPADADDAAAAWAAKANATPASTRMTHTEKAQNQLWTRTHSSYLAFEIDEAEARQHLPQAGVPAGEVDDVLQVWNQEREVERKQLTPAQIKKAWKSAVINPATGAPWTQDEAMAALIGRGYSPNDATTFLNIPLGKAPAAKTLTQYEIRQAYQGDVINAATGAPWTRAEAIAALVAIGYSAADAETFLDTSA